LEEYFKGLVFLVHTVQLEQTPAYHCKKTQPVNTIIQLVLSSSCHNDDDSHDLWLFKIA